MVPIPAPIALPLEVSYVAAEVGILAGLWALITCGTRIEKSIAFSIYDDISVSIIVSLSPSSGEAGGSAGTDLG